MIHPVSKAGHCVACEQALSCGVGGWKEEERALAIMSQTSNKRFR